MSEAHSGIPHDLPEYEPNDPPRDTWRRARVFKDGNCWTWEHQCSWKSCPTNGYPYSRQEDAMDYALMHARRCW
jgi:hypothetical protein